MSPVERADAGLLAPGSRVALLMHGQLREPSGKMGLGLLRYSEADIVAVVDDADAGGSLRAITAIDTDVPVVATVAEAVDRGAEVVVVAVATPGGVLPDGYRADVLTALHAGLSVVNGLHAPLARDPELDSARRPGAQIWDVRTEPPDIGPGSGRAAALACRRVLTVGTDMAVGKMTASLELHREARHRGLHSHVVATGQIGICITGDGVALDAVRVDFATGAVEAQCLRHGPDHDVLWIEGQGSVVHPGSSAWAALIAGSQATDLVLVHRAGLDALHQFPDRAIPPLGEVVAAYEAVAAANGPGARVRAVALNGAGRTDDEVERAVAAAEDATGLPAADAVRGIGGGAPKLLDALVSGWGR